MTSPSPSIVTLNYYPNRDPRRRKFALWFFGILIGVGTILGHSLLGFELSWAQPVVTILIACGCQFLLEFVDARATHRTPRYVGGPLVMAEFLMPAWIVGNAVGFLIFPGARLWPMAFTAAFAIASKVLFRAPTKGGMQHIFNPTNIGVVATLLLFPAVSLAPPYHFTENVTNLWDWFVPGVILVTGVIVHALYTGRLPLVAGWLGGFIAQALIRNRIGGAMSIAPFVPMTSAAFILFTLYMIPDPATTPIKRRNQVAFGVSVALIYGMLQLLHVVFGLFIALATVSAIRGIGLYLMSWRLSRASSPAPVQEPAS